MAISGSPLLGGSFIIKESPLLGTEFDYGQDSQGLFANGVRPIPAW
jgi:hypothetical protein